MVNRGSALVCAMLLALSLLVVPTSAAEVTVDINVILPLTGNAAFLGAKRIPRPGRDGEVGQSIGRHSEPAGTFRHC
jgi:hypothetical protein